MDANQEQVKEFFSTHSKDYKEKYSKNDVFYEYFFFERLEGATQGLSLDKAFILDVGAGTGPLFDFLSEKGTNLENYYATDISDEMLRQSNITPENQFIGDLQSLEINQTFNFVFMLGVTTYMDSTKITTTLDTIGKLMVPGGTLIVTFTNRESIDIISRSILKPIIKFFSGNKTILSQGFRTWYYTRAEVFSFLPKHMKVRKVVGLNHTFFPISRAFPRISVKFARKLHGTKRMLLCSDLLFFVQKN